MNNIKNILDDIKISSLKGRKEYYEKLLPTLKNDECIKECKLKLEEIENKIDEWKADAILQLSFLGIFKK